MFCEPEYNFYEILGCNAKASFEDVKRAYHRLALLHHPDRSENAGLGTEKFHQIDKAWKVLRDPQLRKAYDAQCKQSELEAEGCLVYARIPMNQLETTEDENVMAYQCRCGSTYLVEKEDLQESNSELHIPCQECTFVLIVDV